MKNTDHAEDPDRFERQWLGGSRVAAIRRADVDITYDEFGLIA